MVGGDERVGEAIGFIGFGEAGQALARGLRAAGAARVSAYDLGLEKPEIRSLLEGRAAEAGVRLEKSARALVETSDIVISAVVGSVAVAVAEQAAPYLTERHFYMDLNSTSPAVKKRVDAIVSPTGARFVEAAVMAGVLPLGHRVPILLCGKAAPQLIERLSPLGMSLEDFGPEIGRAAAAKMFRSIVVKGLEALFVECALAASRYGVMERVLEYVGVGYPGIDWNKLAEKLLRRTATHGERRAHELEEVASTLEAMGIEPIMAGAGARRLRDRAELGLESRFGEGSPQNDGGNPRPAEQEKRA
jgi:3-hydroxyisobutyrate dehydrogenase-like beta-hydroxyacid dehydrogenase